MKISKNKTIKIKIKTKIKTSFYNLNFAKSIFINKNANNII